MQSITVTWMDGHEERFTGGWDWEITDGLLWLRCESGAKCIPLSSVRLIDIGEV